MGLIDFILNVAGLLLWLNCRAVRFDRFGHGVPSTLGGTIRRTEPGRLKRWHFLAALGGLLLLRAFFYWEIGPAINWVPTLDLVFVAPVFRGDSFSAELLFSILSFLLTLIVFYFWLIFLTVLNRNTGDGDPFQKMIQLQLGRMARWPRLVQLILPVIGVALLWITLHPLLVRVGAMNPTSTLTALMEQGLLIGVSIYFSLKLLLPAFLLAHLIASYVYLGNNPFWEFVSLTARNALAPLNRLPLRLGKMDFAPLVGVVLVVIGLHFLPLAVLKPDALPKWARPVQRGWTIWPQ
jgi:uncharacterized protein YggT (Ycf19 family)